jgi:hypothetical protein
MDKAHTWTRVTESVWTAILHANHVSVWSMFREEVNRVFMHHTSMEYGGVKVN